MIHVRLITALAQILEYWHHTFPVWSGKFFSVRTALLGIKVLHLRLMMAYVGWCGLVLESMVVLDEVGGIECLQSGRNVRCQRYNIVIFDAYTGPSVLKTHD